MRKTLFLPFSRPSTPPAAEELQKLQRLAELGRVSASLIHEISTPLTAAILELDNHLLGTQLDVRQAQRSLQTMRRYVEAARQQARYESLPSSFTLRAQIEQIKQLVRPIARSARVQLRFEPVPTCRLYGDPVKLQQVIVNLILNAIDAYRNDMSHGLTRPVRVQFRISDKQLTIAVTDWGEGISAAQLPRLFEPFYSTKAESGLGLGLAIVKQYVNDFGGVIRVRTSRRHGTQFILTLPIQ
jgi:two-component system C4-dicarboxylate transport sensor histidine kinase DctB